MAYCENCGSSGIKKLARLSASGTKGWCKPCHDLLRRMKEGDWKTGDGKIGEAHPADVGILMELQEAGLAAAEFFDLPVKVIEHKRRPHPGGGVGVNYISERRIGIAIRLREKNVWHDERLPPASYWDELAQQLAYFRFPRHYSKRCQRFKNKVAGWIDAFREDLT